MHRNMEARTGTLPITIDLTVAVSRLMSAFHPITDIQKHQRQ